MRRGERGQSLVEGTLVMLAFFAMMFGVIDCGQVLVSHQALVERVRSAARWGVVHPWDGTGEQIAGFEVIPLPADSVDVVISNCVINLSTDKAKVLTEIARVLRPGGRVGVSDVVAEDQLSTEERSERGSFVGCIAGALSKGEYEAGLAAAGFENIEVTFTHQVADGMHGAIVKAVKTREPEKRGLPVIRAATKAGCC